MSPKHNFLAIFLIQSILYASSLIFGMVSLVAVIPIFLVTAWVNGTIKEASRVNGRSMLVFHGAIGVVLSPGILVAWGFRVRDRMSGASLFDSFSSGKIVVTFLEIIALGFIVVVTAITVLRAAQAKEKQALEKQKERPFRQKIRDGDIRREVDRPIRKSVKK